MNCPAYPVYHGGKCNIVSVPLKKLVLNNCCWTTIIRVIIIRAYVYYSIYYTCDISQIIAGHLSKTTYLLIYLADFVIWTKDKLHCATARCPDYFLHRSNHTYIWNVLWCLKEVLVEKSFIKLLLQKEKMNELIWKIYFYVHFQCLFENTFLMTLF